jgi:hypothetical protein
VTAPGTTVCIPAWNATGFLAQTLSAVLRQDVPGMRVLVSVDGADGATEAACAPFLDDPRVACVVQPARLGWVGNTNALIAAVETEFFAIMPHDDLPEPGWLVALHGALAAHPAAVGAYADLDGFGTQQNSFAQPEIVGSSLRRRLVTLLDHYNCVPYRGLYRLREGQPRPLLPAGLPGDVAADTAWLMELACQGELRRVPQVLVRKRYHAGNTHGAWGSLALDVRLASGVAVLRRMHDRAVLGTPPRAARLVTVAALLRLLDCARPWPPLRGVPLPDRLAAWHEGVGSGAEALPGAQAVLEGGGAVPVRRRLANPVVAERLAGLAAELRGTVGAEALLALADLAAAVAAARDGQGIMRSPGSA